MSKYLVLLTGDEAAWDAMSPEQQATVFSRHEEFASRLAARGHQLIGGEELMPSSQTRTLTRRGGGGVVVTDGPYAETTEQLGAYYLVETEEPDDLLEICGVLSETDGAIEVRGVVDHDATED